MPIKSRENLFGAWAFLAGIVLAIIIGIFAGDRKTDQLVLGVLTLLGIIVGYFVAEKQAKTFLMASVSLVIVSFAGLQGIILDAALRGLEIGKIVSSVIGALIVLFVPATVVVALKMVFETTQS